MPEQMFRWRFTNGSMERLIFAVDASQ